MYPTSTIKAITELLFIEEPLETLPYSDCVIAFGSTFTKGTVDALELLMKTGKFDKETIIILSGNVGSLNQGDRPEAFQMYDEAIKRGCFIPEQLITEPKATNCYQNIEFSKAIIDEKFAEGFEKFKSILFVAKSFMTRRCMMSASSLGLPVDKIHYYGLVDRSGRNIAKNNWWLEADSLVRVLAEVERIGKYAQKGDLSVF